MKSVVLPFQRLPFPKLMISADGCVVLFTCDRTGTCLEVGGHDAVLGQFSDLWKMGEFSDFNGAITLHN
jgi:hypothetical protein